MRERIIIIGAGGHGKVVCDAILASNKYEIMGFVDSTLPVGTSVIESYKVLFCQDDLEKNSDGADCFIVAIGNNTIREKVFDEASKLFKPAIVIHPLAYIGIDVEIGDGSVILAGSVISTSCIVEKNAIINSGVVIDHDCYVGACVHLSVGTNVGSNSKVNSFITTDIGENIQPFSIR